MDLEELSDVYIEETLRRAGGNRTLAAKRLGVSRKSLWERSKKKARPGVTFGGGPARRTQNLAVAPAFSGILRRSKRKKEHMPTSAARPAKMTKRDMEKFRRLLNEKKASLSG